MSPSKVTCTCTVPLDVLIAVPWTTIFEDAEGVDEDPDDAPDDEVAVGVGVGVETASVVVVLVELVVVPMDGS
ncbi:hypothetical protein AB0I69_11430 [Streptomyces sp. NPDC050508]|uniref:hypothetical protein n=1 Tax=Streptomyces sp. NPDC050508 TaxID=3155405 RepID=UPI00342520C6